MSNDVTADSLRNIPIGTLADGRNAKIRVSSASDDINVAILVQEPGAVDYHGIGSRTYSGSDSGLVRAILESAKPNSLWDASWQALSDGGSYTWGNYTAYGSQAISLRFAHVLSTYTTREAEQATDAGWFKGAFIPFIQRLVDDVVAANPPQPLPPPVYNPYDPLAVGKVFQATIIPAMQATRLTLTAGKVGCIPVP